MSSGGAGDSAIQNWVKGQIGILLGYPDDGALTQHLLSFHSRQQLAEYCAEMMGAEPKVEAFVAELWKRKGGGGGGGGEQRKAKGGVSHDLYASSSSNSTSSAALKQKHSGPAASSSGGSAHGSSASSSSSSGQHAAPPVVASLGLGQNIRVKIAPSKNNAASSIPTVRTRCHCQAVLHPLFSNCTACGKIVCQAEGEGPCFHCGSMVTSQGTFASDAFAKHMDLLAERHKQYAPKATASSSAADTAATSASAAASSTPAAPAAAGDDDGGLAKAEAQRDKLLGFSRANGGKEKIFDQQNDWYEFESNAWLSPEARAQSQAKAEQDLENLEKRRAHTLTIDLSNKKIVAHSSDAWAESMESAQRDAQPKWTDEHAPQSFGSGGGGEGMSHGAAMAMAVASSPFLQRSVEEMKTVSRAQYYANDTLTGRAREVYLALKQSLAQKHTNANDARSRLATAASSSDKPAAKGSLLASLAQSKGILYGPGAEAAAAAELDGLEDGMSELQVEEHLAANRARQQDDNAAPSTGFGSVRMCGGSNDEDEPNCGSMPCNDARFLDEADKGVALSMWQPWASLLVLGIKSLEGRGWYSNHRGRLWIASAAREVVPEEVEQVEAEYRLVYGPQAKIPFPKDYPVGALLGCVDVTAVWSNEEFQTHRSASLSGNPNAEDSQSAFVMVCTNPRTLPLAQSITGGHKLWNLPPRLLEGVRPTLRPAPLNWKPTFSAGGAATAQQTKKGGFDLWPASLRPSAALAGPATKVSISSLVPGVLLLAHAIPSKEQQALVDACRQLGQSAAPGGGFITDAGTPATSGSPLSMQLGLAFNPASSRWEARSSAAGPVPSFPSVLIDAAQRCLASAAEYLAAHGARNMMPPYTPDLCELRFTHSAAAGNSSSPPPPLRSWSDESAEARQKGFPVAVITLGDACDFAYAPAAASAAPAASKGAAAAAPERSRVRLSSGDVLLFGGPARGLQTALERVHPNTKPRELFLQKGTLQLTFRKM